LGIGVLRGVRLRRRGTNASGLFLDTFRFYGFVYGFVYSFVYGFVRNEKKTRVLAHQDFFCELS